MKEIRQRERQRDTAKKIRFLRGKVSTGSTTLVTVQDANGCTASSSSTVFTTLSQLPVQILNITGTTILTCTNPTIVLQATGGVTYNWSGGSTPLNDTNSITQPGLYTVNIVDPNGCRRAIKEKLIREQLLISDLSGGAAVGSSRDSDVPLAVGNLGLRATAGQ